MREIIFRGKPVSDGEYYFFSQIWKDSCKDGLVYGSLVVGGDRCYICVSAMRSINTCINNGMTSMIEVDPKTVGQFTGMFDKNGKRIFEGDIVKRISVPMLVVWNEASTLFEVEYVMDGEGYCNTLFGNGVLEVIGNIHDNPELLV